MKNPTPGKNTSLSMEKKFEKRKLQDKDFMIWP